MYCWAIQPKVLHCTLLFMNKHLQYTCKYYAQSPLHINSMAWEGGETTPGWWIPLNSIKQHVSRDQKAQVKSYQRILTYKPLETLVHDSRAAHVSCSITASCWAAINVVKKYILCFTPGSFAIYLSNTYMGPLLLSNTKVNISRAQVWRN